MDVSSASMAPAGLIALAKLPVLFTQVTVQEPAQALQVSRVRGQHQANLCPLEPLELSTSQACTRLRV
jgi:hypothetical protein